MRIALYATVFFLSTLIFGTGGCAGNQKGSPAYPASSSEGAGGYSEAPVAASAGRAEAADSAYPAAPPPSAKMPSASPGQSQGAMVQEREARKERPGLGTRFGEDRYSPVREVTFTRASEEPTFVAALTYNDQKGVDVLRYRATRLVPYRSDEPLFSWYRRTRLYGGVSIRIVDEDGRTLPTYHVGERALVVGEAGRRYSLVIENRSEKRFEVVASVDGLDVVDGQTASYGKRGYIMAPYGRLKIDGYRRSLQEVAAFRFSSVRDSYAAKTAETGDRHVGVIGVALFAEEGAEFDDPDRQDDAARREEADPFPGRFAKPPAN